MQPDQDERSESMSYLRQMQRGIDYVEEHLEEELSLRDVSRVAGISHWHFQRIFKAMTGETLMTYVRTRRMSRALDRLLHSRDRILDIALDAGFGSQAAFTRAFSKAFGMSPGAFRKLGDGRLFLQKVRIEESYLKHIQGNVSIEPKIIEWPARTLHGLRTEFYGVDSHKNNLGDKLPPLWGDFMGRDLGQLASAHYYGVVQQLDEDDELLTYHAAVELEDGHTPPEGLVSVHVPACTYAVFEHRGPAEDVDHTVNYIYSVWLAQSGRRHTYGPDLEIYDERWHATSPDSIFEYAIPIA